MMRLELELSEAHMYADAVRRDSLYACSPQCCLRDDSCVSKAAFRSYDPGASCVMSRYRNLQPPRMNGYVGQRSCKAILKPTRSHLDRSVRMRACTSADACRFPVIKPQLNTHQSTINVRELLKW